MTEKWIMFNEGQIKKEGGGYEYEASTKFGVNKEDSEYYYIREHKFQKRNEGKDFEIGYIIKDNINDNINKDR